MVLNNLSIITHTHTDCSDLWSIYFDSYLKFFNNQNHLVLINKNTELIKLPQIVYNEKKTFSERLNDVLNEVKDEYIIISLEDMFLYDFVKKEEIAKLLKMMDEKDNISFIRLIKSGINSQLKLNDKIFKLDNNSDFLFSITPTIWRVDFLKKLLNNLPSLNIWELEIYASNVLKNDNTLKLYYYNEEAPRGGHYDSSIYPHVCSAIVKGKWNLIEYKELIPIIEKYNINVEHRGIYK